MKAMVFIPVFFLLTFSLNAQNGNFICNRYEVRTMNSSGNETNNNKCLITIQIYGIGGNDFVSAEIQSENPEENKSYKWHVNYELPMAPDAKGKRIFRSYTASLVGAEGDESEYQITVIRRNKRKKITVAAIDVEGSTIWFYDLEKIDKN
jgi:hypothetical protein